MRPRIGRMFAWLWVGMFVIALATLVSSASGAQHRRLTIFDIHIESLSYQLRALEAKVNASVTSGARQDIGKEAWAKNLRDVRAAFAQLQTEVTNFETRNRTANLAVGIKVAAGLQAGMSALRRAIDGFAQASDLASARTALAGISAAYNGLLSKTADVPDCCLLTCCAIR